jgi:hypothetical protein
MVFHLIKQGITGGYNRNDQRLAYVGRGIPAAGFVERIGDYQQERA